MKQFSDQVNTGEHLKNLVQWLQDFWEKEN